METTTVTNNSDLLTIIIMGVLNIIQAIGNLLKIKKNQKNENNTEK